jgi:hypothetical protein
MQSGCDSSGNDQMPVARLQSLTYPKIPNLRVRKKIKNCKDWAAFSRDSRATPDDSLQMSKSSCTGSWQNRQDSAFHEPDSSKEWVPGTVEMQCTINWNHSDIVEDRRMLTESLNESFTQAVFL